MEAGASFHLLFLVMARSNSALSCSLRSAFTSSEGFSRREARKEVLGMDRTTGQTVYVV